VYILNTTRALCREWFLALFARLRTCNQFTFRRRCVVATANCTIEAQGYGSNTQNFRAYGHVKLNGRVVWESALDDPRRVPNRRGVNVIPLNPFTCSAKERSWRFETEESSAWNRELTTYMNEIRRGDVVVGVTADAVSRRMRSSSLRHLGVADVWNIHSSGSFVFVVQKGFPAKTVEHLYRHEEDGLQSKITATIAGTSRQLEVGSGFTSQTQR